MRRECFSTFQSYLSCLLTGSPLSPDINASSFTSSSSSSFILLFLFEHVVVMAVLEYQHMVVVESVVVVVVTPKKRNRGSRVLTQSIQNQNKRMKKQGLDLLPIFSCSLSGCKWSDPRSKAGQRSNNTKAISTLPRNCPDFMHSFFSCPEQLNR